MDPVRKECNADANGKSSGDPTLRLQSSQDNGGGKSVQHSGKNSDGGEKKESTVEASGIGSDGSANPDSKHFPPWWTKEVEDARRDKNRHYNKFRRSGKDSDWMAFKKARAFARYTIRNAKADHEEKTQAANRGKETEQTESSTSKDGQKTLTEDTEESRVDNSESAENDTLNKDSEECVEAKTKCE